MRKYRIIAVVLITCILTMALASIPTAEYWAYATGNMEAIVVDEERNNKIDQLMSLRCELELEYEENIAQINQIDKQLEALGVEEITTEELRSKMGQSVTPRYTVSSTSTTRWTSRRTVVAYANRQFELQIIEGVPIDSTSPLRDESMVVKYKMSGVVAGAVEAVKVIGVSALGAAPEIGAVLSAGITLYDAYKGIIDSLKTTTVIRNVEGYAPISLTSHMKYIYVKPSGSADKGNQVLCYAGSKVNYLISNGTTEDILVNGVSTPKHKLEPLIDDYSKSYNYSGGYTLSAKNYYDYVTNENKNFIYDYRLTHITLKVFGKTVRMDVPSANPNLVF